MTLMDELCMLDVRLSSRWRNERLMFEFSASWIAGAGPLREDSGDERVGSECTIVNKILLMSTAFMIAIQ